MRLLRLHQLRLQRSVHAMQLWLLAVVADQCLRGTAQATQPFPQQRSRQGSWSVATSCSSCTDTSLDSAHLHGQHAVCSPDAWTGKCWMGWQECPEGQEWERRCHRKGQERPRIQEAARLQAPGGPCQSCRRRAAQGDAGHEDDAAQLHDCHGAGALRQDSCCYKGGAGGDCSTQSGVEAADRSVRADAAAPDCNGCCLQGQPGQDEATDGRDEVAARRDQLAAGEDRRSQEKPACEDDAHISRNLAIWGRRSAAAAGEEDRGTREDNQGAAGCVGRATTTRGDAGWYRDGGRQAESPSRAEISSPEERSWNRGHQLGEAGHIGGGSGEGDARSRSARRSPRWGSCPQVPEARRGQFFAGGLGQHEGSIGRLGPNSLGLRIGTIDIVPIPAAGNGRPVLNARQKPKYDAKFTRGWNSLGVPRLDECIPPRGVMRLRTEPRTLRELHPNTEEALEAHLPSAHVSAIRMAQPEEIIIFTGGSFSESDYGAGWAFTVLLKYPGEDVPAFHGYAACSMQANSSFDTELMAAIQALTWCKEYVMEADAVLACVPVNLYTDNMATRDVLQGVSPQTSTHPLAIRLAYLRQICLAACRSEHVSGHAGDPWNELCNSAAIQARCYPDTFLPEDALDHHTCQMMSMADKDMKVAYLLSNKFMDDERYADFRGDIPAPDRALDKPPLVAMHTRRTVEFKQAFKDYDFTCATCNVDSLRSAPAKPSQMRTQCSDLGIDILGVQEAHTQKDLYSSGDYIVCAGGSERLTNCADGRDRHIYGVELWIAKTLGSARFKISVTDVSIPYSSPRALFAGITAGILLDILVVYAPQRTAPEEDLESFWSDLALTVEKHRRYNVPCIVLGDFNMEPQRCPPWTGQMAHEGAAKWHHLQAFLERLGLWLPYTHSASNADGTLCPTFRRTGCSSNIDHIALSFRWFDCHVTAWLETRLDINKTACGHVALACKIQVKTENLKIVTNRRKLAYDITKVRDPANKDTIQRIFAELPRVAWQMEATSHLHTLNASSLVEALGKQFPVKRGRPPAHWMSAELHMAIHKKARTFDRLVKARHEGLPTGELLLERRRLTRQVKDLVKRDRTKHIYEAQKATDDLFLDGNARDAYAMLKKLKPYKPRGIHVVRNDAGKILIDPVEADNEWLRRHCDKVDGRPTSFEQLHNRLIDDDGAIPPHGAIELLPSVDDIARLIASTRGRRAHGDDLLSVDVFKAAPLEAASALHALYLKVALFGQEPLAWKGDVRMVIPRPSGKWRGVALACATSNWWHRHLRNKAVRQIAEGAPALVLGALPGRGTDFGIHARLLAHEAAVAGGWSFAMLFVDLRSAFDTLQHDAIRQRFRPEESVLNKAIVEAQSQVFLLTPLGNTPAVAQAGVKQGDPLSDLVFVACMLDILEPIRDEVRRLGHSFGLRLRSGAPILAKADQTVPFELHDLSIEDISYIDDVLLTLKFDSAANLITGVQQITQVVIKAFEARDLRVNFDAGKTEVICKPAGSGAESVRRELMHDLAGVIPINGQHKLRVVSAYTHLGIQHAADGSMNGAVAAAAQKMRASVHEFAQLVFKCRTMTRRSKQHAVNICISRSLYAAQTWRALSTAQFCRINTQYLRMMRMVCGDYFSSGNEALWRNEEIAIACGFLPLHTLRFKRLAYLGRVLTKAPIELHALIQMTADIHGGWTRQMRGDLAWLWLNSKYFELMPDPELGSAETAQWERLIRENPKHWKKCLRETAQRVAAGDIIDLYPHSHKTADGDFYCADCDQHFTDVQGLNLHYSLKHDRRTVGQSYAFGSGRCIICLKK
eukprot:TRINITY_DN80152_c0_g1_i1.p1 TRINITY_DN80152_c0_g1~~TRINITY_DN80152_c0_g1_i1.p1  ORF type:complete len:1794 (-),score=254.06 TRINITY_DN80152_c0_g1_i1:654-6035(-)